MSAEQTMKDRQTSKKTAVGRISKPFGAAGELVVNLYDTFPGLPQGPFWMAIDSLEVPLYPESFSRRGRTGAVVAFADIDTPRRAQELIGKELLLNIVPDAKEEDDGQLYMEDLVGYTAHLGGGVTAVVEDFFDSEYNPLFQFTISSRETLVPAAEDFITKVNERRREVWFSLPEGLIDINE